MQKKLNFYKSWFEKLKPIELLPIIVCCKNAQGYTYTRLWSVNWFIYPLSFHLTKISDLNENRSVIHEKNIQIYI